MITTQPDIRYEPLYMVGEAARYLKIPENTLRYWTLGRGGSGPIIRRPDGGRERLMSFMNLVEAHNLFSLTKGRNVHLREIRKGLDYIFEYLAMDIHEHPLANLGLFTDGKSLIVEHLGTYINASRRGQFEIEKVIDAYLERIEFDVSKLPVSIYPFHVETNADRKAAIHEQLKSQPKAISINPRISFGRPVLTGTGIPTEILFTRFKSGDSWTDLAEDYGRQVEEIEAAIRYETVRRAA